MEGVNNEVVRNVVEIGNKGISTFGSSWIEP